MRVASTNGCCLSQATPSSSVTSTHFQSPIFSFAFAQFGSDLDAATQKLLNRGARLTELLKQPQFSPMPVEEQVVSIFAGTNGYLDAIPVDRVTAYEAEMLGFMRSEHAAVLAEIRDTGKFEDDVKGKVVKALDAFCPARVGQRLGIFSGSGVGKSALLAMIARNTACDVTVIALIGERGREVREFIEDYLGPEGLARSVVIVATSDEPAMMRREAAYLALTVGEYFRDRGAHVLCLMDSLTRVAAAQREIGLAAGEPPTAKGYTPSVFSLLPKLLERAGAGVAGSGAITGVFTVLVEGDDHDEPIADAARAILDGHVVLDRRIAERGRFPAVDILKSVSRSMNSAMPGGLHDAARKARALASVFEDMREMIRIGAYRAGANDEVDRAIAFNSRLEEFLSQDRGACVGSAQSAEGLIAILAQTQSGAFEAAGR